MTDDLDQVRITQLSFVKKYSIAVRKEFADPQEVRRALEKSLGDLDKLEAQIEERKAAEEKARWRAEQTDEDEADERDQDEDETEAATEPKPASKKPAPRKTSKKKTKPRKKKGKPKVVIVPDSDQGGR